MSSHTAQTARTTTSVDQGPPQLPVVEGPSPQAAMGIPGETITELLRRIAGETTTALLRAIAAGSDDPVVMDALAMRIPGEEAILLSGQPRTGGYQLW